MRTTQTFALTRSLTLTRSTVLVRNEEVAELGPVFAEAPDEHESVDWVLHVCVHILNSIRIEILHISREILDNFRDVFAALVHIFLKQVTEVVFQPDETLEASKAVGNLGSTESW